MDWSRWFRHTLATRGARQRAFPPASLGQIEAAVGASERLHSGEIRVAIEGALEPGEVWHGRTPRERALEVFAALGGWGAGALLPESDLDLLVLADAPGEKLKPFVEAVLYPLWDAGLTVAVCAKARGRGEINQCGY